MPQLSLLYFTRSVHPMSNHFSWSNSAIYIWKLGTSWQTCPGFEHQSNWSSHFKVTSTTTKLLFSPFLQICYWINTIKCMPPKCHQSDQKGWEESNPYSTTEKGEDYLTPGQVTLHPIKTYFAQPNLEHRVMLMIFWPSRWQSLQ